LAGEPVEWGITLVSVNPDMINCNHHIIADTEVHLNR